MVLCRKCAHMVRVTTLRCPRCGWAFPYFRSRRWKPRLPNPLRAFAFGKHCPRCGRRSSRRTSPSWFRPLRVLTLHRCSYRSCDACGWQGGAFHGRTSHGRPRGGGSGSERGAARSSP